MRPPRPDDSPEGPAMPSDTIVRDAAQARSASERPVRVVDDGKLVGMVDDEAILRVVVAEEGRADERGDRHDHAASQPGAASEPRRAGDLPRRVRRRPALSALAPSSWPWVVLWSLHARAHDTLVHRRRQTDRRPELAGDRATTIALASTAQLLHRVTRAICATFLNWLIPQLQHLISTARVPAARSRTSAGSGVLAIAAGSRSPRPVADVAADRLLLPGLRRPRRSGRTAWTC